MGETLSAKERKTIHDKLQQAVEKMGELTQQNISRLTTLTTLREALAGMQGAARGIKTAEVAWGWIALQQRRGLLLGIERLLQTGDVVRPAWREVAMAKTGMDKVLRNEFSNVELDRIVTAVMVLAHARRAAGQRRGSGTWDQEADIREVQVEMSAAALQDMKQSTKTICNAKEAMQHLCVWECLGKVTGYLGKGSQLEIAKKQAVEVAMRWKAQGVLRWPGLQPGRARDGWVRLGGGGTEMDENPRSATRGGRSLDQHLGNGLDHGLLCVGW